MFFTSFIIGQDLPVPEGLNASVIKDKSNRYMQLSWKPVEDSLNVAYNIFINFPPDSTLYLYGKAGLVWDTVYNIPVSSNYANNYRLSICSIVNFPEVRRSNYAKPIEVFIPTEKLPLLQLKNFSQNNNKVIFEWEYPEIKDLNAYVFYINDQVANTLEPNDRTFSYTFDNSGTFIIELQAVTITGIASNRTQARVVEIK